MEGNYLPGSEEVEQRKADMKYLQVQGIDEQLIHSSMMFGRPPMRELKDAIRAGLSPEEVWSKFRRRMKRE